MSRIVLVDLDGCLVVAPSLSRHVTRRVSKYAVEHLGFHAGTAATRCAESYEKHGTSLEGFLVDGYDVDPAHYHAAVHGTLPYESVPKASRDLVATLRRRSCPVWVFTNADLLHADAVLGMAGLLDCVDGVIGFETLMAAYDGSSGPTACKPKRAAIQLALRHVGCDDPRTAVFFDDAQRNVAMGLAEGVPSFLVSERAPIETFLWMTR